MKKIKLLTPMLSTLALATAIAPIATSCSCTNASKTIPADALKIVGYTLKGIKDGQDLSGYTTLVVPEGVKYIDEGAFTNAFVTAKSDVRTVVLPAGIREIRKGAFKGCTSIRTLDLSAWTSEEIYYMTIADDACEGMIDIGDVILNPDLTEEAKAKVEALFTAAKLDAKWFAPVATGKVVADATWMSQKVETGKYATYLFSTETKLGDTTTLYAQVARTNSTKGVDIEATELVAKGNNVYALPVKMDNTTNDGDYADFNVTFVAVKEGKAIWKQTLEGFKIINIKADTPEPEPTSDEVDVFTYTPKFEPIASTGSVDALDLQTILFEKLEQTPKLLIDIIATGLHDYYGTGGEAEVQPHEGKKIFKIKFENLVIHKDTKSYDAKITITQDFCTASTNEGEYYHQLTMVVELTNAILMPSFLYKYAGDIQITNCILTPYPSLDSELTAPIATKVTMYADGIIECEEQLNKKYQFNPNDKYKFDGSEWNVTEEQKSLFSVLDDAISDCVNIYSPKYLSNFKTQKELITLTDAQKTIEFAPRANKMPVTKAYTDVKNGDTVRGYIMNQDGLPIALIDDYDYANSELNVNAAEAQLLIKTHPNCKLYIFGARKTIPEDDTNSYIYTYSVIEGLNVTIKA